MAVGDKRRKNPVFFFIKNVSRAVIIAVFLLFLTLSSLFAQSAITEADYTPQLPKLFLPSPQAMAYMRYGQIPVSLSSGVPEITIPLYVLKANGMEIPISISYHASGIKVKDIAGTVGLGWALNAGGLIAQTVYGWQDDNEENSPLAQYRNLRNMTFRTAEEGWNMLNQEFQNNARNDASIGLTGTIKRSWYECTSGYASTFEMGAYYPNGYNTVSDRYYYTINGRSGAFRFNLSNNKHETIPYTPLQINYVPGVGFRITDERGIVWTFSFFVETKNHDVVKAPVSAQEYYLTSIKFPGISEEVTFSYVKGVPYFFNYQVESVFTGTRPEFSYNIGMMDESVSSYIDRDYYDQRTIGQHLSQSTPALLSSIQWKNISIDFSYVNGRSGAIKERLKQITVRSGPTTVIKQVSLEQSSLDDRMLLKAVTINDEKYSFFYHAPGLGSGEDFWGYYNGSSDTRIVPFKWDYVAPKTFRRTYLNHREAEPGASQAYLLYAIVYPTKGYTVFEYEQNKGRHVYKDMKADQSEVDYFGGVRVRRIADYDNHGRSSWRYYQYEGGPTVTLTPEHFCMNKYYYYLPVSPNDPAQLINYRPMIYPAEIGVMGTGYPFSEYGASPVFYHKVTEYFGCDSVYEGKNVYDFIRDTDYPNCYQWEDPVYASYLNNCDKGSVAPLLVSKKEYAFRQGQYEMKRETNNTYETMPKGNFVTGVEVKHNYVFSPSPAVIRTFGNVQGLFENYYRNFKFYNVIAFRDVQLLRRIETIDYTYSGQISTVTSYDYDPLLKLLTPVSVTKSGSEGGESYTETETHPFDHSGSVYNEMVAKNILTPVVYRKKYKNAADLQPVLLTTVECRYKKEGSLFVPDNIWTAKGNGNLEKRIQYHAYDTYGNPLYLSKDDHTRVVYLWGYKGEYPVAEIRNATYEQVKTALGNVSPEAFSQLPVPDSSLLAGLRNHSALAGSMVETRTYTPWGSSSRETDANSINTYYNYDWYGNLLNVKDHEQYLRLAYAYQFASKNTTPAPPVPTDHSFEVIFSAVSAFQLSGSPVDFSVEVTGGSGNFTYSWYLMGPEDSLLYTNENTNSNSIAITLEGTGDRQLKCLVKDSVSGLTNTVSVDFKVYGSIGI